MRIDKKVMRYEKTKIGKPKATTKKKPSFYSKIKLLLKEWFD